MKIENKVGITNTFLELISMQIYKIIESKKRKKKQKSHVGEIGPMYVGKNWSGKLDTRLEPAHRYTLQEEEFEIVIDGSLKKN